MKTSVPGIQYLSMNYWSERPSGSQTIPTIVISLGSSPQLDGKTLLGKTQDSVAGRDRQARELLSPFLFSYPAIPRQLLVHSPWPWINGSQTFITVSILFPHLAYGRRIPATACLCG